MPYSCSTLQNLVIWFFQIDTTCKDMFCKIWAFSKINLKMKVWSVVMQPEQNLHWSSSNFKSDIFWHLISRHFGIHLLWKAENWYSLIVCILFMIAFLAYRNDHTFFASLRCFFKFSYHVAHSCQPFVQCLQHLMSDFDFTSSPFGF